MSLRALLESTRTDTDDADDSIPCLARGADLWFSEVPGEVEQAKRLCSGCPVRDECLAGAVERREPAGVWGGSLFVAGVIVPFKRPRGRPPKSASSAAIVGTRLVTAAGVANDSCKVRATLGGPRATGDPHGGIGPTRRLQCPIFGVEE